MCPVYWVFVSGVKLDVKHFECRNFNEKGHHSSTTDPAVWPCPGQKAAAVWEPSSSWFSMLQGLAIVVLSFGSCSSAERLLSKRDTGLTITDFGEQQRGVPAAEGAWAWLGKPLPCAKPLRLARPGH